MKTTCVAGLFACALVHIELCGCNQHVEDKSRATLRGDTGRIFCLRYSPNGMRLALGTSGFDARIWDAATGREIGVLEGHVSGISSLSFSPDGRTLALGSWDETVSLWSVSEMKRLATIECNAQVSDVAYAPNGESLAIADGRKVRFWVLTKDGPMEGMTLATDTRCIAFEPGGQTFLTLSGDGLVKVWDMGSRTIRGTIEGIHGRGSSMMVLSRDGYILALANESDINIMNYDHGNAVTKASYSVGATCLAFSPNGRILAAGLMDMSIGLWDVSNGCALAKLPGHNERVNSITFSPDGLTLASGSDDRTVKLWDIPPSQQ